MILFAFIVNYGNRVTKSKFLEALTAFSVSGYAIPGVILAVAFITLVSYLDSLSFLNFKTMFIGSVFGLVIVYFIRFFALS
jgi:iron(III) transport system permease protein